MYKFRLISVFVVLAVLFSFANVSSIYASPLASLVGEWLLEGNTNDTSGQGNHGSFVGSPSYITGYDGAGQALQFDGVDDGVKRDAPSNLNIGSQSWTVSAWVKVESKPGSEIHTIAARYECGFDGCVQPAADLWRLYVESTGQASFHVRSDGDGTATSTGTSNLLDDQQLHCVVGVLDRGTDTLGLYVDGALENSVDASQVSDLNDRGSPFTIGYFFRESFASPNNFFKGTIDDVRVYNAALSDSEIETLCEVTPPNASPTANGGGPYNGSEGTAIAMSGASASDPDLDTLTYAWTVDSTLCSFDDANALNPNLTCSDNDSYTATLSVDDGVNPAVTSDAVVTVSNVAPTIAISGASNVNEGSSYSLTLGAVTDPGADTVSAYIVHWGDGNSDNLLTHTYVDGPNTYNITVDLTDEDGTFTNAANALSVTVDNVAPTLGAISVDMALVPVNTAINASATFTDPGTLDTHTASWDWGDGISAGTVGSGSVNDSHSYSTPGVYTVKLTVTDDDSGVSNESIYQFVVVYDPSGGFVTGGGWINSPMNEDYQYMQVGGKANFGFVAKYKKGANVPDGNTQFQFKAGDLNFHSTSYEWLVVAGNKAQFKGVGTINGEGSYKFIITADDDNPDTFRIKIWYEENGLEVVVYDNGSQQSLGGGSIKVHK